MIEAVNSVLSNVQLARASAEQVSSSRSFTVDPENSISVPKAPYISPYIVVNTQYNKAVIQIRNSETGDVLNQFPSETRLQAQSIAQQNKDRSAAPSVKLPDFEKSAVSVDVAPVNSSPAGAPKLAEAQQASVALSNVANAGVQSLSAGVTVFA